MHAWGKHSFSCFQWNPGSKHCTCLFFRGAGYCFSASCPPSACSAVKAALRFKTSSGTVSRSPQIGVWFQQSDMLFHALYLHNQMRSATIHLSSHDLSIAACDVPAVAVPNFGSKDQEGLICRATCTKSSGWRANWLEVLPQKQQVPNKLQVNWASQRFSAIEPNWALPCVSCWVICLQVLSGQHGWRGGEWVCGWAGQWNCKSGSLAELEGHAIV